MTRKGVQTLVDDIAGHHIPVEFKPFSLLAAHNPVEHRIRLDPSLLKSPLLPFVIAHEASHARRGHTHSISLPVSMQLQPEIEADTDAVIALRTRGIPVPDYATFQRRMLTFARHAYRLTHPDDETPFASVWSSWSNTWAPRVRNWRKILA